MYLSLDVVTSSVFPQQETKQYSNYGIGYHVEPSIGFVVRHDEKEVQTNQPNRKKNH